MQTDHPTVELFFVFAFTYCKLRIYKTETKFARKILEAHNVEFLSRSDNADWQEFDTRILLSLVKDALPKLLEKEILDTKKLAKRLCT